MYVYYEKHLNSGFDVRNYESISYDNADDIKKL